MLWSALMTPAVVSLKFTISLEENGESILFSSLCVAPGSQTLLTAYYLLPELLSNTSIWRVIIMLPGQRTLRFYSSGSIGHFNIFSKATK